VQRFSVEMGDTATECVTEGLSSQVRLLVPSGRTVVREPRGVMSSASGF